MHMASAILILSQSFPYQELFSWLQLAIHPFGFVWHVLPKDGPRLNNTHTHPHTHTHFEKRYLIKLYLWKDNYGFGLLY